MDDLWAHTSAYYKDNGTETVYTSLSISSFCDQSSPRADFPKLKGKGAEAKDLVPALLSAWQTFADRAREDYTLVRHCLVAQSTLQDIISDHQLDMSFPLETSDHFMANVDAFLHNDTRLANLATRDHELLWNIVPKHHWLWHLSRMSKYLNPKEVTRVRTMISWSASNTCFLV